MATIAIAGERGIDHGIVRVSPKPEIAPSLLARFTTNRVTPSHLGYLRSPADALVQPFVGKREDVVVGELRRRAGGLAALRFDDNATQMINFGPVVEDGPWRDGRLT